ncbi:TetR/AcrR family transcriptional regulator [Spirosoma soli]|uniref:TetR/AcrR family transcriptional regulator n=1 Tax=Spirosoma soli TaxID=1770529 RepID=A0ABW5MC17_9BACT
MGVIERKQREKAYRETSILEAAKKVFLTKGLIAATIDDIAAEAELGKGTLYRHYRSKEDIMLAISERATSELYALFAKAAEVDDSGLEKLLRMTREYYAFVMENPAYFGFIAFFESPLPTTNAGVVYETTNAIFELFQTVLQQGMSDGSMRTDFKANLMANTLWASCNGMMQFIVSKGVHLAEQRQIDSGELFETFLASMRNGLHNPERQVK